MKDLGEKMKRQTKDWDKLQVIPNKGLVSKIYRELSNFKTILLQNGQVNTSLKR